MAFYVTSQPNSSFHFNIVYTRKKWKLKKENNEIIYSDMDFIFQQDGYFFYQHLRVVDFMKWFIFLLWNYFQTRHWFPWLPKKSVLTSYSSILNKMYRLLSSSSYLIELMWIWAHIQVQSHIKINPEIVELEW